MDHSREIQSDLVSDPLFQVFICSRARGITARTPQLIILVLGTEFQNGLGTFRPTPALDRDTSHYPRLSQPGLGHFQGCSRHGKAKKTAVNQVAVNEVVINF